MNFIDRAFKQNLSGDDFLQAMADIYSEPEVYRILNQYPPFVADVISIIDYDTALQMDGLDDIISGNLSSRYAEILNALKQCGAEQEADILKHAKELYDSDEDGYNEEYDNLNSQIALHNDYNGFWDIVRAYIDKNLNLI
ncbi:hypothetical protein MCJ35_10810 [Enterocloster sp. OA13]|uniref:DNA mimic protein DMP19 C-terminal domain-containing protein n=1 Tax=Enterocloster hominis (ex Hitch et al. 2024) TaxID=1917870 RepID=A0ABV1DGL6_9FIRM|nr:hypothetical protein [Lachnoclostridium pacaense]EEQ56522.1 hypothetical protein CBFG_00232 [Clostridiales bacterium 1_7_47FAA]MCC2818142.1 hypothetical protein [Lachnoclostridium pacaense]MCH1949690.1 hypothetical protein [Enterocloster sp. OA13]RJW51551.1 hypothetical protein DXC92_04490 [Clostridiales bacterium TF09-2AC]